MTSITLFSGLGRGKINTYGPSYINNNKWKHVTFLPVQRTVLYATDHHIPEPKLLPLSQNITKVQTKNIKSLHKQATYLIKTI